MDENDKKKKDIDKSKSRNFLCMHHQTQDYKKDTRDTNFTGEKHDLQKKDFRSDSGFVDGSRQSDDKPAGVCLYPYSVRWRTEHGGDWTKHGLEGGYEIRSVDFSKRDTTSGIGRPEFDKLGIPIWQRHHFRIRSGQYGRNE